VKKTNTGMHDDLLKRYEKVLEDYNAKQYAKESKYSYA
jgi:hypothetical protein